MQCLLCENFSLSHICESCQKNFLSPSLYKRKISHDIEVLSFYRYDEIKMLLHTKHTDLGYYIYSILAQNSFQKFANEFLFDSHLYSIAIDDNPKGIYSHTAILNRSLKGEFITPIHGVLRAKNSLKYSGENREFRLLNSRNFSLKTFHGENIILVDDIITTGSTFNQAIHTLHAHDKKVLFCLTLADVNLK